MQDFSRWGKPEDGLFWLAIAITVWEMIWKGKGMWRAARQDQGKWFVAILLINTMGILPIVYLNWFSKDKKKKTGK